MDFVVDSSYVKSFGVFMRVLVDWIKFISV